MVFKLLLNIKAIGATIDVNAHSIDIKPKVAFQNLQSSLIENERLTIEAIMHPKKTKITDIIISIKQIYA